MIVAAAAFDTLQSVPEVQGQAVRFVQTVGGRAGFPAPRRVRGKPFFRINSATAWTTLALTIHTKGSSDHELVGASPVPRHWVYDRDGTLVQKAGTVDFRTWYRQPHGKHTPWGDEESAAFVTEAESALERQLSRELMQRRAVPTRRRLEAGDTLVEQGEPGDELYLLLDGVLAVEVDGEEIAEIGPCAILGERAVLEGGRPNSDHAGTDALPGRGLPRRAPRPHGTGAAHRETPSRELTHLRADPAKLLNPQPRRQANESGSPGAHGAEVALHAVVLCASAGPASAGPCGATSGGSRPLGVSSRYTDRTPSRAPSLTYTRRRKP